MSKPVKCDDCKKEFDASQVVQCRVAGSAGEDDQIEHLCPECIEDSGYCRSCGEFCSGMERFDFGPGAGFCDNCLDQIQADSGDGYSDEEEFPYGSLEY